MKIASAFALLNIAGLAAAITPAARFRLGCAILQDTIYCYGGGQYVAGASSFNHALSDHLMMPLTADFKVANAQSNWTNVPAPKNYITEPNYAFAMTAVSKTQYVIQGGAGYNDGKTMLKNKTVLYDAPSNTWQAIATAFNQTMGSSLNVDQNNNTYLFGGEWIYTYSDSDNFMTMNLGSLQWISTAPTNSITFLQDHASDIDAQGIIYYVGGKTSSTDFATMTSITTYNTVNNQWGSIPISGTVPSIRNLHTFTYMPKANKFVLFGGKQGLAENPKSITDICYTFDPVSKAYTAQNVPTLGSGSRYGHAAVYYMDMYLFIIFGADGSQPNLNSFAILDTTSWNWVDTYSASGNPTLISNGNGGSSGNGNSGNSGSSNDSSSGGIGSGAIAGIVIAVVAVGAIAGGAFFFIRRRNNQRQQKHHSQSSQNQFTMDPTPPNYFTSETQHFMMNYNGQNNSNRTPDPAFFPDGSSTTSAPTYTSASSPLVTSPSTLVGKPDISTIDEKSPSSFTPTKPHGMQ
ncbi:hypothetical protein BC940DRAFT_306964 [Gongronella butleri]|nr:hypothetical protein BC940DRAFT_306964 [Gongronella butleri]